MIRGLGRERKGDVRQRIINVAKDWERFPKGMMLRRVGIGFGWWAIPMVEGMIVLVSEAMSLLRTCSSRW